jgi:PAS domain S-box-containing protein
MLTTVLPPSDIFDSKLESLINLTGDALVICDNHGQIIFINSIFEEVTKYKKNDLAHQSFTDFITSIDTNRNQKVISFSPDKKDFFWGKYKKHDGGYIWLKWDVSHHQGLYYCSAKDLSPLYEEWNQLKVFKEVLKKSEKATIIAKNIGSNNEIELSVVYANDAFIDFFGEQKPNILGKSPQAFFDKDLFGGSLSGLYYDINNWTVGEKIILTQLDPAGKVKTLECSVYPNVDEKGVADFMIIQLCNVSKKVDTVKELYTFRAAIDNVQAPMIISEAAASLGKSEIVYVNKAFEKLVGRQKHLIIGQPMRSMKSEDTSRNVVEKLNRAYEASEPFNQDIITQKDGKMIFLNFEGAPILDSEGKVTHWAFLIKKITDSYKLNTQIKDEILDRIIDLEASNKKLESFAAIISHDLKTPLRAINNYLILVQKEIKSKSADGQLSKYRHELELLQLAQKSAVSSYELVQGVLSYSKIMKGEGKFEIVDLNMELANLLVLLEKDTIIANAIINYEQLPILKCDKVQIRQLFQNLISNALNYRNVMVCRINITFQDLDNGFIQISVRDNGIGIEEADKAIVFDLMKRGRTQKRTEGNGIGLAICQEVVKNHGGEIWVTSILGKETTFHFTIKKMI